MNLVRNLGFGSLGLRKLSLRQHTGLKFYRGQDLFQLAKHLFTIDRRNFFHIDVAIGPYSQGKFIARP